MNKKTVFIGFIAAFIAATMIFEGGAAKSESGQGLSIGVVSVKRIFDESKKYSRFRDDMTAEQERVLAELEKARADIEAERAGLKTLKQGTTEYMGRVKVMMEKQAKLTAEQEFQKQQLALKERQLIEQMHTDIVRITGEVAQKRGLDLVLENSEIELAEVSDDMLVMSMLMRTVMYSSGCVNITDEVMKEIDSAK
ncbi:MAG: OmpH family outer membrane protein [Phycisphaerae bacterium]|jgi:Skp family chaperone for outer membrane proteins